MSTLRRLVSSHLFVFSLFFGFASILSAFGQTATLSTTSHSFGNVAVGSASNTSNFTLRNTSTTAALAISNIGTSGDFSQTNTCGSSIAARGNCTISVKFSPTAVGARTGALTISDNATPATQTATLTGTGTAPVTVSPATRSFNNVGIGSISAPKTFTLSNKGTTPISFTISAGANASETDNCSSVAGGASCTINASFAPTSPGAATGTIGISYSGVGSPLSVSVSGTGIAPLTMSPATRAFGNVGVGSVSAAKTFTVSNKGTSAVALTVTPSAGFTETDNCSSVAGGGSCTINASFAPTAVGAATGSITVSYSGYGSPLTASVSGTAIAPLTLTPAQQAFGNVAIGTTSATKNFTVTNKGSAPQALTITASTGFNQTNTCGSSLAGNASCTITTSFAPTAAGAVTGTVTVGAASLATPLSSAVSGTGIAPVTVTPATLAFSTNQGVGVASASKSVTIRNAAAVALPVQSIVVSPADYTQTNNCGTSIRANNSCTVNVVFKPLAVGTIPGTLTINDSAVGSPQIVTMTGAAVLNPIRTLAITPATATVAKTATLQFKATATYTNGTTGDVTASSVWTSTNPAILSIVSTTGLATGVTAGSTSVSVTVNGTTTTATKNVTVTPPPLASIALSPATISIAPGATTTYTATGTYTDLTTAPLAMNTLTLTSSATGVATIAATGVATGINGGTSNITATSGTIVSAPAVLTVTGPTLQSITVAPAAASVAKGATQQFTATGNYSDATTKDLTTTVAWSSSSANLTISNVAGTQGLGTAAVVGSATVTASWTGGLIKGTTTVTIIPPPLTAITVTPATITVGIGAQQQYAATGTYSDTTTADITSQVAWSTSNSSVAGINSTGLATVFGTLDGTAVTVTATLGAVSSNPPAYINAVSTLPRVCPNASVDMKVLVVNNSTGGNFYADLPAIKQILDFVGTPYDVVEHSAVNAAMLSDGTCHGYYQAVIMAFGDDIYSGNPTIYHDLNFYETTFHVRQVNWYFNPTPDYGFTATNVILPSTSTYTANFTPAAAAVFPNINTTTPLTFTGASIYLTQPFTPAAGATVTPLVTDSSNNVLSAIWAPGDGREILSQLFDSNQYLKHNLVLAYGLLNWATRGVFLGDYHVYAAGQVDDFFINDAEWTINTPCTDPITHDRTASDAASLGTYRLKYADMVALTAWQNSLQSDPMLAGFKLTLAMNGVGTVGNPAWTGLPMAGITNTAAITASNPNGVVDDLVYNLASYESFYHWVTHTYDHPNTLNGLHKSDTGGDTDNPKVDSIDLEILTNLYVAGNPNGVMLDVDESDTIPPAGATGGVNPLHFTDFDPRNLISPGVTGLNDAVVPQYLAADGIQYAVSDTSVIGQDNNGPNPSPNVGIINSFAPSIYEVPRYPNDVYFNAATWEDDQAEFHCIYNNYVPPNSPVGTTPVVFEPYASYTAQQIIDYTTDSFVVNMLKGDMDPQMFHQPNLHAYDGTNSMISDVYNGTFAKYKAVYKLPVLSLTIDQLAESMKKRAAYNKAGATGTILGVGTATPSVAVTVPAANPGAVISVSGLASNGSELYGGTNISHIQIGPGQTVTLPLQ